MLLSVLSLLPSHPYKKTKLVYLFTTKGSYTLMEEKYNKIKRQENIHFTIFSYNKSGHKVQGKNINMSVYTK